MIQRNETKNENDWRELTRHVAELEQKQTKLNEELLAKESLLSICSHELKTPLTSISLQTQMARRSLKKGQDLFSREKIEKLIQITDSQDKKLLRLVEDMLDHSRIQVGKFTITREHFDLCELVKEIVGRYEAQATSMNGHLDLKTEKSIVGFWDRLRIEQVVTNLINNAFKFGNGKPIRVEVAEHADTAWISVQDSGNAIPSEHHTKVFHQFEQLSEGAPKCGMGLGLFISKAIIELHGGSIGLESSPGLGARFTVKLPLSAKVIHC